MNKEQQELLDEAYEKYLEYTINGIETGLDKIKGYLDGCLVEYDGYYEHFTNPSFAYGYRTYNQEEFINKIKTDDEFANKWGLKIEERDLSLRERSSIAGSNHDEVSQNIKAFVGFDEDHTLHKHLDEINIPTRLITITYNDKTIEGYE
jgi:hypothetical protein